MGYRPKSLSFQNRCGRHFHDLETVENLQHRSPRYHDRFVFNKKNRMSIIKLSCDIVQILISCLEWNPLYIAQKNIAFRNRSRVEWHISNSKHHGMNRLSKGYRTDFGIFIVDFLV